MTTIIGHKVEREYRLYVDSRLSNNFDFIDDFQKWIVWGPWAMAFTGSAYAVSHFYAQSLRHPYTAPSDAYAFADMWHARVGDDEVYNSVLITNGAELYAIARDGCVKPIYAKSYGIGSGCDYALGAIAMGATPIEAIKVAMKFDLQTGGKIHEVRAPSEHR